MIYTDLFNLNPRRIVSAPIAAKLNHGKVLACVKGKLASACLLRSPLTPAAHLANGGYRCDGTACCIALNHASFCLILPSMTLPSAEMMSVDRTPLLTADHVLRQEPFPRMGCFHRQPAHICQRLPPLSCLWPYHLFLRTVNCLCSEGFSTGGHRATKTTTLHVALF